VQLQTLDTFNALEKELFNAEIITAQQKAQVLNGFLEKLQDEMNVIQKFAFQDPLNLDVQPKQKPETSISQKGD